MASIRDMCHALDEIWKLVKPGDRDWHTPDEVWTAVKNKLGAEKGRVFHTMREVEETYFPKLTEHKRNGGPHHWVWRLVCQDCGKDWDSASERERLGIPDPEDGKGAVK